MRTILSAALIALGLPSFAHNGVDHATAAEARAHAGAAAPVSPLPFDVGGAFALQASTGSTRTEADPEGRMQLLFFGYANCEQICSAALPLMGEISELAAAQGVSVRPVMITVDPKRDTPQAMAQSLPRYAADFVGLTGSDQALEAAYDAFSVERKVLFHDPEGQPVFAHGSFIYLLDGDGAVLTLIPPVVAAAQAAQTVIRYAPGS